jgi:hypothetical protein
MEARNIASIQQGRCLQNAAPDEVSFVVFAERKHYYLERKPKSQRQASDEEYWCETHVRDDGYDSLL